MPVLEKLLNLIVLSLMKGIFVGKEIAHSACEFLRLQALEISCLEHLEWWRMESCSMLNRLYLSISICRKLLVPPEGLQSRRSLQELKLSHMIEDLNLRALGVGEDWYEICHLHSITIC
ncbi:RNI-like protein [Dioscorea alata]|uniref:RNI-like protein n=1 Tax=Dioscorea alata TaxID=55571 RepID=A0ACB7VIX0_DIOAL|nr:RNI-like protein [Dioscorea alata]